MYAVGKVGTFFAQSVYTVSGPFHPFGGAVDIIVVQQEDGTFKSSPWYVKFGKFQGVLKRREKKVVVGVNDSDADFHMYLDHKGEAYFLKDAQGEGEVATFSPPEATSSGDENSSHMLALEYPRVEEGAHPISEQLGKEESEDDLELRFEGRNASKQLIQQSVEERATAAAAARVGGEEIIVPQGNYSGGVDTEIRESSGAEESFSCDQKSPGVQSEVEVGLKTESSTGKIVHALLNKAVGLEASVKSSPASALLANAAYTAVLQSSSKGTDNVSSKEASTKVRRTASSNGIIVHGLLNQALGLQPSHKSGPASCLIAAAALASLRKAVSDVELESFSKTPHLHAELVELPDGDLDSVDTIPGSPVVQLKEEFPVDVSTANPNAALSLTSNGNTSDDMLMMKTLTNIGSVSESEIDQFDIDVSIQSDPILPSRTTEFFEVKKTLEVKKMEILDKTLVVEVQEHVEKESLGSTGDEEVLDVFDANDRVEKIVFDRKQIMETVNNLQGISGPDLPVGKFGKIGSKDAQALELAYERALIPEEVRELVSVHVDKALVEKLQGALTPKIAGDSEVTSGKTKDITTPGTEVAILSSGNAQNVRSLEVPTPGQELPIDSSREVPLTTSEDVLNTLDMSSPGKELALQNQVNFSNVKSPRQKAAIELEMAWREVMEKAAATLKGVPYTGKRLNHSQSYKKKGLETGQKKSDSQGGLPEQSEKKTWGVWWWGGSSAPQAKQIDEQGSSKERKDVQEEMEMEHRDLDFDNTELRDPSSVTSELEDVAKRGPRLRDDVEGSDSIFAGAQSESDSGQPEGTKAGSAQLAAKVKSENLSELVSDNKVQQKGAGETPSRRTFFGLLSRTNTNQSSLSSASSLRSNDDLESTMSDGLRRNTSLESADSVVDLLDEKWAKGSETRRARVEGRGVRAAFKEADSNGTFLSNAEPARGSRGDESNHSPESSSILDATVAETALAQSNGTQHGVSTMSTPNLDQGAVHDSDAKAEEDGGGNQEGIKINTVESDVETTSTSALVLNNPNDLPSISDMKVLLMSVDGQLVRAPLGLGKDEAPLVADDSSKAKRGGNSPKNLVCFATESEGRPSLVSPDTHTLTRNGVKQEVVSHTALEETDGHVPHDPIESKTVSPACEGLKGLTKLLEHDDGIGAGQQKVLSLDAKTLAAEGPPPDQLGPGSKSGEASKETVLDESHTEDIVDKEFNDRQAMVLEKLEEPGDGEALDEDGQIERYFSSRDLTQAEEEQEKRIFRRNLSVYMDAQSGEDEQDSADSDHQNDTDQARDKSGPIGIPGARDSVRNFSSDTDMHILRSASESLPNERLKSVDPEMLSPRLPLSRSLDSASPPLVLNTLRPEMREQFAASDSLLLAARPFTGSPVKGREKIPVDALAAERTPEDSEQRRGQKSTAASRSSSMDDGGKGSVTGFELSLCRHLLKENMGLEAAAQAFNTECVTLDEFKNSGSAIVANDKLVVKVGGRYYPWAVAAPIVLGILAFGKVLIEPNEGAIAVEQPIVVFDGKPATTTSTAVSGGGWKLWPPWGSMRRPKTPERPVLSREAMMVATEAALKSNLKQEYLRVAGYYMRPRKVRTNSPSSPQLAALNLKEGSNKITFTFETRVWGKQQVDARIYLWKWNTRIVISDVDGTITKSDVLGQVMPLMGKDWTQIGVARLFSAIKKNGYELMFLSARAISQAYLTRQFLENIKQDGEALPDGPVVISPDGLFPSLYREVIRRAPHEFKIACLEDIKSLFPPESKPFYAGFGNRDTDELSYLKVGIPKGKIFIINPKGEVVVNNQVDRKSYSSLHTLVDDMFPAMSFTEQEDYNEWNYWKIPLPEVDDDPSVKSLGSTSSRKSGKSGRRP